ncbi:hypothetical protein FQR65_LT19505 [Abscondita terminalis]|nr:hypothetical protein FQR65_LT19505 [Abscondita terminalis]
MRSVYEGLSYSVYESLTGLGYRQTAAETPIAVGGAAHIGTAGKMLADLSGKPVIRQIDSRWRHETYQPLMSSSDTCMPPYPRNARISEHANSLKPSLSSINAGRVGTHRRKAPLLDVLREQRIAGAGFDVFFHEPLAHDSELLMLPHITLTPHIAGASNDVVTEHSRMAVEAIERWEKGDTIPFVFNARELAARLDVGGAGA